MKRALFILALVTIGCGVDHGPNAAAPMQILGNGAPVGTVSTALELEPDIRPEGLDSLYSRVAVTDLTLFGALHLVPTSQDRSTTAASAAFKFELDGGEGVTTTTGRALRVDGPGRYTVLMTIHPFGNGASVNLEGSVLEGVEDTVTTNAHSCRGEAAPTTADEAEMEAAPTTADEGVMEAAPTTAVDDEMEAAPTTADEDEMEAAPITADEVVMEAAPTTADGMLDNDDDMVNVCRWETRFTASNKFSAVSTQSFEFDLGIVDVAAGDKTLSLFWDMSDFIALLMGKELGLSFNEMLALHEFFMDEADAEGEFTPDEVRIETD